MIKPIMIAKFEVKKKRGWRSAQYIKYGESLCMSTQAVPLKEMVNVSKIHNTRENST